ncbi:hypothetical protein HD806DRAFT_495477 [Xylariaceae sp. AK1471]|nr:hypothetical protein HD806DRAFT_495477 [Xylariaceae sp. AK1471]
MEKPDDANYHAVINFVIIKQVYFPDMKLSENHCDGEALKKEDLGWTFRNDETGKKFKAAIERAMENVADNPHGIKGFTYSLSVANIWSGSD